MFLGSFLCTDGWHRLIVVWTLSATRIHTCVCLKLRARTLPRLKHLPGLIFLFSQCLFVGVAGSDTTTIAGMGAQMWNYFVNNRHQYIHLSATFAVAEMRIQ